MLSDFRFSRGGVLCRMLGLLMLAALIFIAGCAGSNTVTIGPPAKLAFTTQPGNAAAGGSINVTVSIEDASGNVVPTATNQVTIAIGTNPSSGTLSGTATATAVAGVATFTNLSINNAGTGYTLTASAAGLTGTSSSAFNVAGPPTKLAFTVAPSSVAAGISIAPAVTVSIEDASGNVVPTVTNQVTIAIGTNPSSGTLGGTVQANAVAGVATFSTLSINKVGTGYTLTASATGLTSATSGAFNVTAGAAAKLVYTVQPANTTAGVAVNPAVQVTVEDSQGNVVTTATNQVTIAIGTNPSGGALSGTAQANAVAGVATFSTLSINKVGTGYTLTASATGLTGATSSAFNVLVGAAAKLAFTVAPSSVAAGSSITPAVTVSIEDAAGNVVLTATNQITIAIGTNPSSGTLSGTAQANAVAGVATFSTLSINKVGTGYTLTSSATGLTGATSTAFNVTTGAAAKLVYTAQPTNTTAGVAVNPAVKVTIEDSQDNVVTTATNQVTIAIGTNPSSGTLSGTAQVNAVAGVATFSTLSINSAGTGYTLAASATGLTGATSSTFNVLVGAAAKLVITTQPTSAAAGVAISPSVAVSVEDTLGNVVTTATNQITIAIGTNPSSGTLSGTVAVNAVNGVATFSTLSINHAGAGYTLTAGATGLAGATSSAFNITAGPAAKLAFTAQPVNTVASTTISPSVSVSVEDALGNVVTTATNQITIAIGSNPSSGSLSGTVAVNAVNGVATFSTLDINNVGNGYTLTASASGLAGVTSGTFNIIVSIGPPAKLAFTVQPSNVVAGSSIAPAVQVSIEDSNGNVVTSATTQITIAIGTNPSSGTLSGTVAVNAVSGVASFSTLSINKSGTGYTLGASASGLTGATSGTFNVTAAAPSKLAFTVQPSTVVAGSSIAPAVQVSIEDAQGNLVTTATDQITIAIGTNPSTGTLSGTAQLNATAGVASFSTLSINKAGTGYTLGASASGLTSATSSAFNVTPGAASNLAFTVQPSNVSANISINPAVQVSIEDNLGNLVTTATNQITIAIGTNPSSGTLSGTAQLNAVAGVATFSALSINNTGTGYTLTANATGLTGATSNAFNVTAAPPSCGTGSESLLTGQYAFALRGFDASGPVAVGGIFNADGAGHVATLAGVEDINSNSISGVQTNLSINSANSSYKIGSDHRGCLTINTTAGTQFFRFSLGAISSGVASLGHIVEFDNTGSNTAGELRLENSAAFSTAAISGSYAFGASGPNVGGGKFAVAGMLTLSGGSVVTTGANPSVIDTDDNGTIDQSGTGYPASPISLLGGGLYSIGANGRGTLSLVAPNGSSSSVTVHIILYVVSSTEVLMLSADAQSANGLFIGSAQRQSGGPFSTSSLNAKSILYTTGLGNSGGTTTSRAFAGILSFPSTGNFSFSGQQNNGGTLQAQSATGTYAVASDGRVTFAGGGGGAPIIYLVSANKGFAIFTDGGSSTPHVESGFLEPQTGGPSFSTASANGTYAFGTIQPDDVGVSDEAGIATFNKNTAQVSGTSDQNSSGTLSPANSFGPFSYSVDSTGLGVIPAGCNIDGTTGQDGTCQTFFYIISPTKAVVIDATSGSTPTDPHLQVADQ